MMRKSRINLRMIQQKRDRKKKKKKTKKEKQQLIYDYTLINED
jgi:hypothetical protein